MERLLDDMEDEMRTTFRSELEIFYRMSGVFVQILMLDAEKQKATIKGEVTFMENYKALQDMKEFEDLVMREDFTLHKKPTAKA
jgi:multidrug efflux pump subunit AcrA (membrane-fusion protein)